MPGPLVHAGAAVLYALAVDGLWAVAQESGPEDRVLPNGMNVELGQLCPGVFQPISVMSLGPAGSDVAFEALYLVGDCPAAYLNGTMPVRVHTTRSYPTSVTRGRWISSTKISASSPLPVCPRLQ